MKKILLLILTVTLIKGIIWAGIIPIFQAPDEPLHFAHTQYFAENFSFKPMINTASIELEKALKALEWSRIAFHPKQKQSFSKKLNGLGEKSLLDIKEKDKKTISKKINYRSQNPPLFYILNSIIYWSSLRSDLIWRFFSERLLSITFLILTFLVSKKILEMIFKQRSYIYSVLLLISFLPMISFSTSSVNSDNLFMLLVTLSIYYLVRDAKKNLDLKETLIFSVINALAFLTKQSFIPIFFFLLIFLFINSLLIRKKIELVKILLFFLSFFILSFPWLSKNEDLKNLLIKLPTNIIQGRSHYEDQRAYLKSIGIKKISSVSYFSYLNEFIRLRQPQKVFNYFWGTFGWVDTRLPKMVYYSVLLVCFFVFLGFLRYLILIKSKWKENIFLLELILLVVGYTISLSYYEWRFYQVYKDFFLQGRYLFPLILPIMTFFTIGWTNLFPKNFQKKSLLILILLIILFNFYCLFLVVLPRYYDTGNLIQLVKELSQYKPVYLKGLAWPILIISYLILCWILMKELYKTLWKAEER